MKNIVTKSDCLCEKNDKGGWLVSAIIEGFREHMVFYGYSKKTAITLFVAEKNG